MKGEVWRGRCGEGWRRARRECGGGGRARRRGVRVRREYIDPAHEAAERRSARHFKLEAVRLHEAVVDPIVAACVEFQVFKRLTWCEAQHLMRSVVRLLF